jgi:hypothetical protein
MNVRKPEMKFPSCSQNAGPRNLFLIPLARLCVPVDVQRLNSTTEKAVSSLRFASGAANRVSCFNIVFCGPDIQGRNP